jgi:hypothetical protein
MAKKDFQESDHLDQHETMSEKHLDDTVKDLANKDLTDEFVIKDRTEIGEAFDNLDNDSKDKQSGMSNIDFNARLEDNEIKCITIIDEFTRLGILPSDLTITRQRKRLSVSHHGKGRQEKVAIAQGAQEKSSGGWFKNLFTRRE